MNVNRDPDPILTAWLEAGPIEFPESTRRAIAVSTRATRQSRLPNWAPLRFPTMIGATQFALGAMVVVAVALGGLYLFNVGERGTIGGPGPTASPTPTPMPFPSETSGGIPAAAGTYVLELPTRTVTGAGAPVRITFTVSSGWQKNVMPTTLWHSTKQQHFGFFTVDNLTVDPCPSTGTGLLYPPLGPTVDDLVAALPRLTFLTFSAPTDTTIAGFTGKQLEVRARAHLKCGDTYQTLSTGPQGAPADGGAMAMTAGERGRMVILDVDGVRLVIALAYQSEASADDLAELQAILDYLPDRTPADAAR